MSVKRRTIGSLTHADFGSLIEVPGQAHGILWSVQHVAATGDIPEPWTRLIFKRANGASEGTRGLPPGTPALVTHMEG
jgi:hypothetical protein